MRAVVVVELKFLADVHCIREGILNCVTGWERIKVIDFCILIRALYLRSFRRQHEEYLIRHKL